MSKLTALFFLIMFVIGTDTFLISPLIPTLQRLFEVPTEMSGWMIGSYTLGAALFALIAGPLSDGWDRKKVMLAGMVGFSLSTLLCGLAADFWSMCLFRFLAGVSAAFTAPQVWASIPTLLPAPKAAKTLGVAYAGLAVSQALGVPIGSSLAAAHWSYPFYAIGSGSLLLAVFIYFALPAMKPKQEQGTRLSDLNRRYVLLLGSGKARGVFLSYLFIHLGSGASFAFLGKWMADRFGLSVDQVGVVIIFLGVGNLIGSLLSAYVIKALNRFNTMVAGTLLLIVFFVALPHLPTESMVTGAYFLIFAVLGTIFPLMVGVLTSLNPTIRGTISSLSTSIMNAATTLGSWTAGLLYAFYDGYSAVAILSEVCLAISLFFFIRSGALSENAGAKKESAA